MKNLLNKKSLGFFKSSTQTVRVFMHPVRDWYIGLCILLIFIIVGAVVSGYLFHRYNTLDFESNASEIVVRQYQENLGQEALRQYIEKSEKYSEILQAYTSTEMQGDEGSADSQDATEEMSQSTTTEPAQVQQLDSLSEDDSIPELSI